MAPTCAYGPTCLWRALNCLDPYAKGAAPGGGIAVGSMVMAQHPQNHQWYPGRVSAMQSGMIGVDWDDPAVGESSWVMPAVVQPR